GFAQFFGRDPFLSANLYTFDSSAGRILRVLGTLGHADYLGNFLLYTTPVSAALATAERGRARWLALTATLLSITVMIFSGTRGAMVGVLVGALVLGWLLLWRRESRLIWRKPWTLWRVAATTLIIIAVIILIAVNPASRNIGARARAVLGEGASG